jgi:hypothetical protein
MTDTHLHPILEGDNEVATLIAAAVAQGASLDVAVALANTAAITGWRAGRYPRSEPDLFDHEEWSHTPGCWRG